MRRLVVVFLAIILALGFLIGASPSWASPPPPGCTFFDWLTTEHPEVKRVVMAYEETPEGMALRDAVQACCTYYGLELCAVAVPVGPIEWYPTATKMMAYDPDLAIGPTIELFEAMREMGYEGLCAYVYCTYTHPETGMNIEYPCHWQWLELEEIMVGVVPATDMIPGDPPGTIHIFGWESPMAEDGYYPNLDVVARLFPLPFPPRALFEFLCEPGRFFEQHYPGFTLVWDMDTTTAEGRVCVLFSFIWSHPEAGVLQDMGVLVCKGSAMYMGICETTQETYGLSQEIFRYICQSITVPSEPWPWPTPPPPVGGTIMPTDKGGLVMPWIMAAALIVVAGVSLSLWNRKRGAERTSRR